MFEAYVSNEDNVIIASVNGIKEQIEEGNALIDDAELPSTIENQILAYVIAERKIKTLIRQFYFKFSAFSNQKLNPTYWMAPFTKFNSNNSKQFWGFNCCEKCE